MIFRANRRWRLAGLVLLLLAASSLRAQTPPAAPAYTYRVLPAAAGSFGYEIQRAGQPFIRQTTVPGLPGTTGFRTAAQATRVARLVVAKLQRGADFPTVTVAEIDSLHARP